MNQNVMNWRNQKGMPEIEKIIADFLWRKICWQV